MITSNAFFIQVINREIPIETYQYISMIGEAPMYVIALTKRNLTCKDFRDKSKTFFIGTNGTGSATHIPVSILKEKYSNYVEVPYKGGGQAIQDLLSGQIDSMIIVGNNLNLQGTNIIANSTLKSIDGIPTMKECFGVTRTAVSDFVMITNNKTDEEFIKTVNQLMVKFVNDPSAKEFFKTQGIVPQAGDLAQTMKQINSKFDTWRPYKTKIVETE
jgi:tripartite-type tricarboxylate transporter receptor subunit TctC